MASSDAQDNEHSLTHPKINESEEFGGSYETTETRCFDRDSDCNNYSCPDLFIESNQGRSVSGVRDGAQRNLKEGFLKNKTDKKSSSGWRISTSIKRTSSQLFHSQKTRGKNVSQGSLTKKRLENISSKHSFGQSINDRASVEIDEKLSSVSFDYDKSLELRYLMGELAYEQEKSDHLLSIVDELQRQQAKLEQDLLVCRQALKISQLSEIDLKNPDLNENQLKQENTNAPEISTDSPDFTQDLREKIKTRHFSERKTEEELKSLINTSSFLTFKLAALQEDNYRLQQLNKKYVNFLNLRAPELLNEFNQWNSDLFPLKDGFLHRKRSSRHYNGHHNESCRNKSKPHGLLGVFKIKAFGKKSTLALPQSSLEH